MRLQTLWATIPVVLVICFLVCPVLAVLDGPGMSENRPSLSKRVVADGISPDDVKLYEAQGCVVKHVFKDSVSFDCPVEIIPDLKVREARVYHIQDLSADRQTGADLVWAQGADGSGVNVAVLDTGIDTNHPELTDSYLGGYDCVNNDNLPEDDHGHGTHVAGIITADGTTFANSRGVAPGAGVYMYKVCDSKGSCYDDDMRCGMEKAVLTDAKVMSISIGGGSFTTANCDSDYLAGLINTIVSPKMTAVIAAGNDGRGVSSPGCASTAIAVGAVDSGDNVPYWSGRGPALDILAPGVSILSTTKDGKTGTMSGTSMATPHVAGVVSLLYDANAGLTTAGIRQALSSTADPASTCSRCTRWIGTTCLSSDIVTCTASITGAGVVDAFGAYSSVKTTCSDAADCDNGLYCDGEETCDSGSCVAGTPVSCTGGNSCSNNVCNESLDQCVLQPKADGTSCSDGAYCNGAETCQAGTCSPGTAVACNDGRECSADSCDEVTDACVYDTSSCTGVQCWSGANAYLVKSDLQAMKFCRCAAGSYGFTGYSTITAKKANAYKYTDTGDNSIWTVARVSTRNPISSVECSAGNFFLTNRDYSR